MELRANYYKSVRQSYFPELPESLPVMWMVFFNRCDFALPLLSFPRRLWYTYSWVGFQADFRREAWSLGIGIGNDVGDGQMSADRGGKIAVRQTEPNTEGVAEQIRFYAWRRRWSILLVSLT